MCAVKNFKCILYHSTIQHHDKCGHSYFLLSVGYCHFQVSGPAGVSSWCGRFIPLTEVSTSVVHLWYSMWFCSAHGLSCTWCQWKIVGQIQWLFWGSGQGKIALWGEKYFSLPCACYAIISMGNKMVTSEIRR